MFNEGFGWGELIVSPLSTGVVFLASPPLTLFNKTGDET